MVNFNLSEKDVAEAMELCAQIVSGEVVVEDLDTLSYHEADQTAPVAVMTPPPAGDAPTAPVAASIFPETPMSSGGMGAVMKQAAQMGTPMAAAAQQLERTKRIDELRASLVTANTVALNTNPSYLIKDMLGSEGISFFYGPSHTGKSFLALDMGMHIAAQQPWAGQRVSSKAGKVLYIPQEGAGTINNRLVGLREAKPELVAAAGDRFATLPRGLNIQDPEEAESLRGLIESGEFSLVILDTLAASMGELDENAAKDTGLFMTRLRSMLPPGSLCQFLLVAHTGKDETKGLRGSYAMKAGADTMIAISVKEGVGTSIVIEKLRDGESEKSFPFILERQTLGHDIEGEEITSRWVRFLNGEEAKAMRKDAPTKPARVGVKQLPVLCAVAAAIEAHGVKKRPNEDYPIKLLCVSRDQIQDALIEILETESQGNPGTLNGETPKRWAQKKLSTTLDALEAKHRLVAHHEDFYWIADDDLMEATLKADADKRGPSLLNAPTATGTDDGSETFVEEGDTSTDQREDMA